LLPILVVAKHGLRLIAMRRSHLITSVSTAVVAALLAAAPAALAAAGPPMTVNVHSASGATGNYFKVTAQPGQTTAAGTLTLTNQTAKTISVKLDPVSGMTASTLGSAYGLPSGKAHGAARWLLLDSRRVSLAPHARRGVAVSVQVPGGTSGGDYLAGISVEAAGSGDRTKVKGNLAISQVQRYAVGVDISLPGPRHPLIRLTGVDLTREPAGVTFSIQGRNAGNVILQNVRGAATVSDGDGVIAHRTVAPGTFVTGTSIAYPLLVTSLHPSEGSKFRVQAFLKYRGGTARIDKTVTFGAADAKRQQEYGGPQAGSGGGGSKLLPILIVLALIAGCLALLEVRRRRGRGARAVRPALEGAIAHARAADEPLSVILIGGQRPSAQLAAALRPSLRRSDQVLRPSDESLLVVAPDTTPQAGEVLAAEIKRHLSRAGNGAPTVVPVTSAGQSSADELLDAAAAVAAPAMAPGNGTGNGAANGQSSQTSTETWAGGTEASAIGRDDRNQRPG
jgi:hypothetical protein